MSKRFTDTNKWDQAWFRKLSPKLKCLWMFMVDRCDHAGVLELDLESMAFFVGEGVIFDDILNNFGDRIDFISDTKIVINAFIDFQYGDLNPDNRVHKSVIQRLEKLGPKKGLIRTLKGTKDKDKDKDLDKSKEKEEKKNFKKEIEEIYSTQYPLKVGKTKGVEKLLLDVKSEQDLEDLKLAVDRYKKTIKDPKFIKHFSTFATTWREWLDVDAGSSDLAKPQSHDVSHIWNEVTP